MILRVTLHSPFKGVQCFCFNLCTKDFKALPLLVFGPFLNPQLQGFSFVQMQTNLRDGLFELFYNRLSRNIIVVREGGVICVLNNLNLHTIQLLNRLLHLLDGDRLDGRVHHRGEFGSLWEAI